MAEDDDRASAYEAEYELTEIRARKGLEYLDDDPDAALDPEFVLVKEYEDTYRRRPDDASAHEHYGHRFMQARMHEYAISAFHRAAQLIPDSAPSRYNYAEAIRADVIMKFGGAFNAAFIQALEPALAQYEAACRLDPSFREARLKRDEVCGDIGIARLNEQRKMQILEQIINNPSLDKDAVATRLIEEFGADEALQMIDQATELSRRKAVNYTEQAEHYEERARHAEQQAEETLGRPLWNRVKRLLGR
jgi:tetratricopeptide (TPR) repeat protein